MKYQQSSQTYQFDRQKTYFHGDLSPNAYSFFPGTMKQNLAHIAIVVREYDEAIEFYRDKLNFVLIEDTRLNDTKRWVLMSPPGSTGCQLLLARGVGVEQESRIGNQTGGRVFLFLYTDNFQRDYDNLLRKGVTIVRTPSDEPYGTVAVFADLYGNLWDLIEPKW